MKTRTGTKVRRGVAAALAVLLLIACVPLVTVSVSAASVSDLEKEIETLEKEAKKWADKIKDSKNDKKDAETQKAYLDKQISSVEKQIDLLDSEIAALNKKINAKNTAIENSKEDIKAKEEAIRDEYEEVRFCVRGIAKRGIGSDLQFLLNMDSYTDYLLQSKMMERIVEKEQATLNSLEAELSAIEEEKTALETEKKGLQNDKKTTDDLKKKAEKKQDELDKLYDQSNKLIASLNKDIEAYKKKQKELEKAMEELEEDIKKLQNTSTNQSYKSGSMYWPAPGVTVITSHYGMRWGRLHKGTDIAGAGAYGKSIVAAADGVVTVAKYHSSYGNYVMVDHGYDSKGRRIMTLYAHMSKIKTKVGAKVIGGKTELGKIGSTGNSTGPHLHFEVRVDGSPVNAVKNGYISKPK